MDNHYILLGVKPGAGTAEIKRAFREKAKQFHPDITGAANAEAMRKLIAAYEALCDVERRFEHDRIYSRYAKRTGFDYRTWLNEQGDPGSMAKLVFYEILRLNEDRAIEVWRENGGINFQMEKYLARGDWLDLNFLLAEELDKRGFCFEAFKLLAVILAEEARRPYFNLFTPEIKHFILAIAKRRLKEQVDNETWIGCMQELIGAGFSDNDEKYFKESISLALKEIRAG